MLSRNIFRSYYPIHPLDLDKKRIPIVRYRYTGDPQVKSNLDSMKPNFGFNGLGEFVYNRTYSRIKRTMTEAGNEKMKTLMLKYNKEMLNEMNELSFLKDADRNRADEIYRLQNLYRKKCEDELTENIDYVESQEKWSDTIFRAIEGAFSYKKDFAIKNNRFWDDIEHKERFERMCNTAFKMYWTPPGRGLWGGGTEYTYERGSTCLNNCALSCLDELDKDLVWIADLLMCGCGVGVLLNCKNVIIAPNKINPVEYLIADNREGWAESIGVLAGAYLGKNPFPKFNYSLIRKQGEQLKGFGGLASGSKPLIDLHKRMEVYFDTYILYQKNKNVNVFTDLVKRLKEVDWWSEQDIEFFEHYFNGEDPIVKNFTLLFHYTQPLFFPEDGPWSTGGAYNEIMNKFNQSKTIFDMVKVFLELKDKIQYIKDDIKWPERIKSTLTYNGCIIMNHYSKFFEKLFWNASIQELVDCIFKCNKDFEKTYVSEKLRERKVYDMTRLTGDLCNAIGACVVAGNVRRSSELHCIPAGGKDADQLKAAQTFYDMKVIEVNPERAPISYISNNSIICNEKEDFRTIHEITNRVIVRGEPGFMNGKNLKYGRLGRTWAHQDEPTRERELDKAVGLNPCLTGDTLILTTEGEKRIDELLDRQFTVVTPDGEKKSTSDGFWSMGEKYVIEIHTETKHLKLTDDHKIAVYNKRSPLGYEWVEAGDISKEHYIMTMEGKEKVINWFNKGERCEVFDCSIPGTNCMIANGLLVHNCGEIPLEDKELCNLAEVFMPRCIDTDGKFNLDIFLQACKDATFYTHCVSLLPTHWDNTNEVIARNRRIGVSISGFAEIYDMYNITDVTEWLREGYRAVSSESRFLARQSGTVEPIRKTTVKPSGTISLLAGVSPGMHFPTYDFCIRRVRLADNSPIAEVLKESNYKHIVPIPGTTNTICAEFVINQSMARKAEVVTAREQMDILKLLQKEWADNSVSCTVYFNEASESKELANILGGSAKDIKSVSFLPHTKKGAYNLAPYEGITETEYKKRERDYEEIDWSNFGKKKKTDGEQPLFCTNESCG